MLSIFEKIYRYLADEETSLGWHFTTLDKKLQFEDNRLVEAGKTLTVSGVPKICEHGLHAGRSVLESLQYAPGPFLWRVELSGVVVPGYEKSVATKRKALWGFDASELLNLYTRKYTLAQYASQLPDITCHYLETGDSSLEKNAFLAATTFSGYHWNRSLSQKRIIKIIRTIIFNEPWRSLHWLISSHTEARDQHFIEQRGRLDDAVMEEARKRNLITTQGEQQ